MTVNHIRNASEALAQAKRHDRAKQILAEGYTFHKDADSEVIAVCKPGELHASYWINMLSPGCCCPDFLKTGKLPCKHMLAWDLLQQEEAEAVASELAGLEWQCAIWEDQNTPELPEAPAVTVEGVWEALRSRLVQDFDKAEEQIRSKQLADTWTTAARHKHLNDLTGCINTLNNYMNEGYVSSVAMDDPRF